MRRADATIDHAIESLHHELHVPLKKFAHDSIMAFATHFRAQEKSLKEEKHDNYFPSDCETTMKLQTSETVAKGPGFKDLDRETQDVVIQCR